MISRWDAIVNAATHEGYEAYPSRLVIRCERCSGNVLYILSREEVEIPGGPIIRMWAYRCAGCGSVEITVAETYILGGGRSEARVY